MSLSPGSRIGLYEIVAAIGAGGMGEVYRARDTKLQRDVAIKVLPDLFARDPERLARFEREARTLASLNHPHIAQVHGVEGTALVMELVEGDDLSQRIDREGAIPLDEAIPIAIQITEAVAAAHEQGIIHRDLKPANIKVREDGTVKVLDFGLAKALAPPEPRDAAARSMENSPTITSPFQMSQLGVALGTAAYMAPEQAKGKPVDKRADIWAFGCVLFEMLTGRKPFDGEDVTDVLAAIVRDDPDWSLLPAATPPGVRTLLRRCLEKDRRDRLPDIGAARLELRDASGKSGITPAVSAAPSGSGYPLLPWLVAGAAIAALIAVAAYARLRPAPAPDTRVYQSLIVPPTALAGAPALRLQISPDGSKLAFAAPGANGRVVLWVRPLDSMTARPLEGTTNAASPFWSPDSRWIAFLADGKLKKVESSGGAVITLCDAGLAPPGAWNRDDVILFSVSGGLARVSAAGGKPAPVLALRAEVGERVQMSPSFLPDGRHFLFTAGSGGAASMGVDLASLDSPVATKLIDAPTNATYASRHLIYLLGTTLVAHPFDPETRTLSGQPVPIAEQVQANPATGTGAFSVSQNGLLVYQSGTTLGTQLVWFDRTGKRLGTVGEAGIVRDLQLAPDEAFASFSISAPNLQDSSVWLFDLGRKLTKRLTFGENAYGAVWTPDGRFLIYAMRHGNVRGLYRKAVSGLGTEELLLEDASEKIPVQVTSDGTSLLYEMPTGAASAELFVLPLSGQRTPRRLSDQAKSHSPARISPDRRWLAYVSDETTRREVYVTSFPDGIGKWQISSDGGDNPRWRADSRELFFTGVNKLMAVDVTTTAGGFDAGPVRALFDVRVPATQLGTRSSYAVAKAGDRFLFNTWDVSDTVTPITLVVNWPQAIKK